MSMSQTAFNTDIENDSAALMPQNGERKANDGRKRVLIVGAGAAGYVEDAHHKDNTN
jgi:hypothetical protein